MLFSLLLSLYAIASVGERVEPARSQENVLFTRTVQELEQRKLQQAKKLSHKSHAPILLSHAEKTEYVVVLIHGLYESPRTLMGLAQEFYDQGMNVYLPLLPGHWNRNFYNSDKISYTDWLKEIDLSVKVARNLGKKTIMAGFSLGGLLATYATLKFPEDVQGLVVLSPAYGLSNKVGLAASLGNILGFNGNEWEDIPVDGLNVPYFSLHMASQLFQLHGYFNKKILGISRTGSGGNQHILRGWDIAHKIRVPTFVAYSEEDEAISRYQIRKFFSYLKVAKKMVRFDDVKHTATPKSRIDANPLRPYEFNPHFDFMADHLREFLKKNF